MEGVIVLVITALVIAGIFLVLAFQDDARQASEAGYQQDRNDMPAEIASGTLALSEDRRILIGHAGGHRLTAKPDQVFLTRDGRLIPVENKVRARPVVYPYDLIELSVQALTLVQGRPKELRKHEVAPYGYVRAMNPSTRKSCYLRVELLSEADLGVLASRYVAVRTGRERPSSQQNRNACARCQFLSKCQVAAV